MLLLISIIRLKDTTDRARSVSYLQLEIDSGVRLRTKLYDKRDSFNFLIVNFPVATFLQHLILEYVYPSWCDIPELVAPNLDFLDRGLLLTGKLLNAVFLVVKLNSSQSDPYFTTGDNKGAPSESPRFLLVVERFLLFNVVKLHVYCSVLWCRLRFSRKNDVRFSHLRLVISNTIFISDDIRVA